ncbi:MAG: hypothetical protein UY39_C0023G0004 [Candidatus Kaiserbacteria bacterium GW2011_GWC2_49_12]|uniref:Plasmid stabilization system n=4 Tax=Candidatus Kaiseribacteriota TaxID=1752734 RepID=A0A0G1YS61_9BACT|nr:MAG: hypothetical protein UY39_C0023G0004 [Candidatus Kaiserbacteria bacterium GW2011_GWC2_49_12]KKW17862.1 MAG: hypothetical protein UY57_C0008G0014 [Candidatus Kaiserbacteria bacterium GW2011_GWB1_50_17]KKW18470.1 MAG: hypothetical protein UY59_C0005G0007 [Candidatus Kaiserbacteria bacterium GW2011_GWA1_50_28]OGG87489.1 MAG: hypothetical protein A3H15_01995 [Candidatus Kaiserbacteria bacterium RIFCSPLOWO2_12_FULL_50_28]HCM43580.1 hypothetical protein [Candidatus Kaiserbacteria bacterium]
MLNDDWRLEIDPRVWKELAKIPGKDRLTVISVIESFSVNPYFGDIRKLKSKGDTWRRRVGSYRVYYELNTKQRTVSVFHFERRTSTTY